MRLGDRSIGKIAAAAFEKRHYIAAGNMLHVYVNPLDALGRYLFTAGKYPATISVNTPLGKIPLSVYSYHDVRTVNEIFSRLDYRSDESDQVVVDFGSNIGISAAYFLTRSPDAHVYLFEPLEFNIDRLRRNLKRFEGRYTLFETAVGPTHGVFEFGWEKTGRYGGIGMKTGQYVAVKSIDSNEALAEIVAKHGRIDVLKVDIETLEKQVTSRIPIEIAKTIKRIYVEYDFASNPLEHTHRMVRYGRIAQFTRLKNPSTESVLQAASSLTQPDLGEMKKPSAQAARTGKKKAVGG